MTPPPRDPLENARRSLDEAAGALDGMRRLTATEASAETPAVSASESVRREALAAARDDLRRTASELESERARGGALLAEVARLREELAARPTDRQLEEARLAGEADGSRRASESGRQVAALQERVALLSAEHVRLETLRRKAETSGANSEASRRALEETLRRDLRAAHAALDRAASEAGTRDAKAVSEIEEMRKRLDQALNRLHREELLRRQASVEEPTLRGELEAAQAVIGSLRRELAEERTRALERERALEVRVHELTRDKAASGDSAFKGDFEAAEAVIASLRKELSEQRAAALGRERALELAARELEGRLAEATSPAIPPAGLEAPQDADEEPVEYPPLEYALEPGWARLFRLVKPPLQAAYGHLRRLSAGPMTAGQRAVLRLTGSSLSQAADALATIELALSDSPATVETAPVLPVLESVLASWEAAFRRRGIALTREISRSLPDSPHDPEHLGLALHHVLRNALEALPRGGSLRVQLSIDKSAAGAVRLEFRDDGPGYPPAWLLRRFEPFAAPRPGHAGLGLAAVRRAMLRWGGDASAANGTGGGACLTLAFAATPPRPLVNP